MGDYSTFNFTGRDGIILGSNANFTSGEYSNVHFENKGRGVALDLGNNSNIEISRHSNTYFHSVGKTNGVRPSGSYDGYNYIGVNEGGNITVDKYATFRVILEGRGNNAWDDVVSLDSRNANTHAAFTSKTGAIVDIRDDNTNFYAELISFPLGNSYSRIDTYDLQIKDILLKSTVFLEKDVSSYNFLDLYNFTHDVMFSADFGSNKIFSDFSKDIQDSIWRKAKTNLYLALLSKHVDLLFEYEITLLILNKAANYKYEKELTALFNLVYESFILPYFQDNKKINKQNYHTFLVLGLLSGTYERTKRNTRENTKIIG